LFAVLLQPHSAFAKFDPAFTWTTLETPHFFIHYHQGEEDLAKRTAVIAEDVHERLVPRLKWAPKSRTHVVLVDSMDDSNGSTTTFPYNHVTLFLTRPIGPAGLGASSAYDDWMRLLFTHEYVHVLQIDMVSGVPEVIQDIFGRIYFPNSLQPVWLIEGLAVYEETEQTAGGRGRSPGADMVLRMAALEGPFPSLDQAAVFPDFWPAGQVPYLFGESFTRYIAEQYGRDKLADISTTYSGRALPYLVTSTGRRVLQRSYSDLWFEWQVSLRDRYRAQERDIRAYGLTQSKPLTGKGYYALSPVYSPDGTRIAYTVSNADEFPAIYVMNSDGTNDRKLVENTTSSGASGQSVSWSPDSSGIYYTKLEIRKNTNLYNDIYYYDIRKGTEKRITRGLRARDPHPSPDGKKLVFVTNKLGSTRLGLLDIPKAQIDPAQEKDVTWLSDEGQVLYETPRFSPDGTMLATGVWQPGGYRDIWILDAGGKKLEELMRDRALDSGASWSPDGKLIYFSSDRTGVFNLYAYDLEAKTTVQVTNVLGGAFSPSVSPANDTLVFTSYGSKGFDLHQMPLAPEAWKPAGPFNDRYPSITYQDKPVDGKTRSYNPFPTLLPRFWVPWFGYSDASRDLYGFLTYGQDAIARHAYLFSGLYSPATHRKWHQFSYAYDGLYPTVLLSSSDLDETYSGLLIGPSGQADYVERRKELDAALVFPLLSLEDQHALTLGYRRSEISALTGLPSGSFVVPAEGLLVSGRAGYLYNNAQRYGNSISPEHGRTLELGYEQLDHALDSDFNVTKYTADWHEYVNAPWKHHVLLARAFGGVSRGDVLPQRAFQLGGDLLGDMTIPVDQEFVSLRGYPANQFRGQKAALASLEYRFPLRSIESGLNTGPFFLRRLHGAVFAEAGNAWDDALRLKEFKSSVGAEGRLDLFFSYFVPITLRVGVAKGLDEQGETMLIVNLWTPALF
jgi:hypothetical protein